MIGSWRSGNEGRISAHFSDIAPVIGKSPQRNGDGANAVKLGDLDAVEPRHVRLIDIGVHDAFCESGVAGIDGTAVGIAHHLIGNISLYGK